MCPRRCPSVEHGSSCSVPMSARTSLPRTRAPSTTKCSPASASAPHGVISAGSVSTDGQSIQSLCLPILRRGHRPLDGKVPVVWRVELDHRGGDCLLYTSDAADDLTRVDLGGR